MRCEKDNCNNEATTLFVIKGKLPDYTSKFIVCTEEVADIVAKLKSDRIDFEIKKLSEVKEKVIFT